MEREKEDSMGFCIYSIYWGDKELNGNEEKGNTFLKKGKCFFYR